MTLRMASLGLVCALMAAGAVACGDDEPGKPSGGSGGSGGTGGTGGTGGQAPPCENKVQDPGETDIDCGGPDCDECGEFQRCTKNSDCERDPVELECVGAPNGTCQVPISCDNERMDGTETDVDCGGVCVTNVLPPQPCALGEGCLVPEDCETRACDPTTHVCVPATCSDGQTNGTETDEDCGGNNKACARCKGGDKCAAPEDCESLNCKLFVCEDPTCEDNVKNGTESDIDCGGTSGMQTCPKCPNGDTCVNDSNCESGICTDVGGEKLCSAPSCTDGVLNQDETCADGGGVCTLCQEDGDPCSTCPDGEPCARNADCDSGVCSKTTFLCQPPSCSDGVKNADETGIDCGGSCPGLCPDGDPCVTADDCASHVCEGIGVNRVCQVPTCIDNVQNGGEPDIDCGGPNPECPRCTVNRPCLQGRDCDSSVCGATMVCKAATCDDGTTNGDESDRDCGGADCDPCLDRQACNDDEDCLHLRCIDGQCDDPECGDNVIEGDEQCEDITVDGERTNTDGCSNSCKRPVCGDGIVQQVAIVENDAYYNEKSIAEPRVLSPFGASGRVCGKGGTCAGSCDIVDDEDAPEHGICQALGYGSAVAVEWGGGTGADDLFMPHASNWECTATKTPGGVITAYTCKQSKDGSSSDDCSDSEMLVSITCMGEQCDDGEDNSDELADKCRKDCRKAWCGDGVQDRLEQCDHGNKNSDELPDACRTNCKPAGCQDGVVDKDEECDDGNDDDTDACLSNCTKNPDFPG